MVIFIINSFKKKKKKNTQNKTKQNKTKKQTCILTNFFIYNVVYTFVIFIIKSFFIICVILLTCK